jgi:hypothetical protein
VQHAAAAAGGGEPGQAARQQQQQGQQAGGQADCAERHESLERQWQRPQRTVDEGGDSQVSAAPDHLAPKAAAQAEARLKRHRQGRRLSAEERLVLGVLSDPRFSLAERMALPQDDAVP